MVYELSFTKRNKTFGLGLGYGFEIRTANITGVIVIISSLALTIIFWLFSRGFI